MINYDYLKNEIMKFSKKYVNMKIKYDKYDNEKMKFN